MAPNSSWLVEGLGLAAGACLITAFLPQTWKVARTRSVNDLSLAAFCLQSGGVVLWIIYGALIGSWALIITNSLCLSIYLFLIALIKRYKRRL